MSVEYIYLYWIYSANTWGIYGSWRVSVPPLGAGLGNKKILKNFNGVKLYAVSNCPFLHMVSNCPRCQIVLVSNCPVSNCPGVKLSGVKLSAVSNCPVSNCPRIV